MSPLVSQTASPNQSRSTSPHRTSVAGVPLPLSRIPLPPQQQPTPPPLLQPNALPPPPPLTAPPPLSLNAPPPPVVNGPQLTPAQVDVIATPPQMAMEHHPQSSLQLSMFATPTELKVAEDSEITKVSKKSPLRHIQCNFFVEQINILGNPFLWVTEF